MARLVMYVRLAFSLPSPRRPARGRHGAGTARGDRHQRKGLGGARKYPARPSFPRPPASFPFFAGNDSAISFARTLEYYWPLSRQVYVDFQRQRDLVEGVLCDSGVTARRSKRRRCGPFRSHYPQGGCARPSRTSVGRECGACPPGAPRGRSEPSRATSLPPAVRTLLMSAVWSRRQRDRQAGEEPVSIEPSAATARAEHEPGHCPPQPGFRIALEPGDYSLSLEQDGKVVPGTEQRLRVISPSDDRVPGRRL